MYALEGRATDTYLKTRRNRRSGEDDVREDLLAISRAGHASRRDASFVGSLLLARSNVTRDVLGRKPVRRPVSTLPIHRLVMLARVWSSRASMALRLARAAGQSLWRKFAR